EDLIVFPNPATNEVRIQNVSDEAILEVSLIDLTGRICRSWGTGVPVYDLSDVSSGHYLLKIRQDSGYTIKQLIRR
ncbi:MAG: T9SS type A sorting domain-containing protein, partial [Flavobacteriales bacterium]